MKKHHLYSACIVFITTSLFINTANAQESFVVIVNKNVTETSLNWESLRRIYFGFETKWRSDQQIKISYTDFSNQDFWNLLATSKSNYDQFWMKREYSGNGSAPVAMTNGESIIDYVSNTDGAIGVIQSSLIAAIGDDCKVVTINGW